MLHVFKFLSQFLPYFYSPHSTVVAESVLTDDPVNTFLCVTGIFLLGINFKRTSIEQNYNQANCFPLHYFISFSFFSKEFSFALNILMSDFTLHCLNSEFLL